MIISLKNLDDEKWLPDVISAMIEKDIGLSISAESIYSYIYNSDKSKSLELYKLLPQRRFIRLKHGSSRTRTTILGRQWDCLKSTTLIPTILQLFLATNNQQS